MSGTFDCCPQKGLSRMEENKENRSLLTRTMSFRPPNLVLSAKALRKRFALSKRSMSDTWKDRTTLIEENCSFSQVLTINAYCINTHLDRSGADVKIGIF
jgi:hypothetical protein